MESHMFKMVQANAGDEEETGRETELAIVLKNSKKYDIHV